MPSSKDRWLLNSVGHARIADMRCMQVLVGPNATRLSLAAPDHVRQRQSFPPQWLQQAAKAIACERGKPLRALCSTDAAVDIGSKLLKDGTGHTHASAMEKRRLLPVLGLPGNIQSQSLKGGC
jgi:hypothetical protein